MSNSTEDDDVRSCKEDTSCHGYATPKKDDRIDGPWACVVALATFVAHILLGGYIYTGGIYYTVFREEFPVTSTVAVSWLCTLPLTLFFIASPIGSVLTNMYGCRACSLCGGIVAAAGLALCYFATSFYSIFSLYGLTAGVGYGVQYVGFVTAVSRYFVKHRTVATIISTSGLTLGMSIYAFLVPHLTTSYSWRGSLLIIGGITLNLCVCACVLFPITTHNRKQEISFKLTVLSKKYFTLMCCQCFFTNLSNSIMILYLPSLILSFGLGTNISSMALTLLGVFNFAAKICHSVVGHFFDADVTCVYTISLFLCGVATSLFPVLSSAEWILCMSGVLGATYSVTGGHSLMIILRLAGHDHFSVALGINQVFKAAGTLLGGPLAGMLLQTGGTYSVPFYVGGMIMSAGCTLMVPLVVGERRGSRRGELNQESVDIEKTNLKQ